MPRVKGMRGQMLLFLLSLVPLIASAPPAAGSESPGEIKVLAAQERGEVNKWVFGNNLCGYDPMTYEDWAKEYRGFSDFGEGFWDPLNKRPVPAVLNLAREAGITAVRFPGGCGTHHYNWKRAVGKDRSDFLFGIEEFLQVARRLDAEPVITVSYFTGNQGDAADLVEYLNTLNDGSNWNGGKDWAAERARNGHPEPYGVRYFEIGNEVWHGDHKDISQVSPQEYAVRYLAYYAGMKAVDSSIQIGALLKDEAWTRELTAVIGGRLDFGVTHFYFSSGWAHKELSGKDVDRVFYETLNEPQYYAFRLQTMLRLIRNAAGRELPIAFTEYNTAFHQNKPVPYRHCLGAALVNAEVLRVIMDPENHILMANYWDLLSRFWGMLNNFQPIEQKYLGHPYTKRPNFYVYELYHKHFGQILLETSAKGNAAGLSINASKSKEGDCLYLMVINKSMDRSVECSILLEGFAPASPGQAWVLNGPGVDATNEEEPDCVKVTRRAVDNSKGVSGFAFEPHSLTAIEFRSEISGLGGRKN